MALGADGNIAILSRAYYDGPLLITLSPEGSIQQSKVYHFVDISSSSSYATSHPHGGYVLTARGRLPPRSSYKVFIIKVTGDGDVEWSANIDDTVPADDRAIYVRELSVTDEGDIIVMGDADRVGSSVHDTFLVKLSATGSLLWWKTYGIPGYDF